MISRNPIVVVHGIQGSWLKDEYPVDYQDSILWTGILRKNFKALHLHALDPTVDADPSRLINPHQAIPLIYEKLVEEIRDELQDVHPYIYMFTYDWRKDTRLSAVELGRFVDRVLHIAGVHERSGKGGAKRPTRVSLVGHSMGGLTIKWYATRVLSAGVADKKIERIITIATPYRGSLKAIEALLPGARNLFGLENNKSMRHAARTMPGIYQLLPTWDGAVVRNDDARTPLDVFDPMSWQKNLIASLSARFDGRYFGNMLTDARAFTQSIAKPWPVKLRSRVYTAYGINTPTWRRVEVETRNENRFRFDKASKDADQSKEPGGDGTVHTLSSIRKELTVPTLRKTHIKTDETRAFKDLLAGHHASMPNHDGVQDWVLSVLRLNPFAHLSFDSSM